MSNSIFSTEDSDITELFVQILKLEDNTQDEEKIRNKIIKNISDIIDELTNMMENFVDRISLLESEKKISILRKPRCFDDKPSSLINPGKKRFRTLKEYLVMVPEFDGISKSVEDFTFDLKLILYCFPEKSKISFLRLVHENKLIGIAKQIIDRFHFQTEEEFFDALLVCNANPLIFSKAKQNRSKCVQGFDSILDYNIRFLQAHNIVRDTIIKNPILSLEEKKVKLTQEQENGLLEYVSGLNENIRVAIIARNPKSLNKAQYLSLKL
ncbi:hypothetical protein M0802_006088 [Mischocyttarus mexicanus]|nr:hypothetical protein M0802_006088 [Mischocyttarus mexicanus]